MTASSGSADRGHTVDWDARAYDRVADPQVEWAQDVLARLDLTGDETVLDAGCGSGRVTEDLLRKLPDGHVIGVDASPSMIMLARQRLDGDRVELLVADLTELELGRQVDAVFSNATFHWVIDHDDLFRKLFAAMRPGGVLEAQCGGEGNVAEWMRALQSVEGDERFAPYLRGMPSAVNFASVGDTRTRLERAGFEVESVWLEEKIARPREPREFVRSVGSAKHLDRLPAELHGQFVDAVLGGLPRPLELRYMRLNISARRPA